MLDTIDMKWSGVATFNKVSFNESAVLFYIKKVHPDARKYQEDNVELDIYIPSINLAIEYDGEAFHNSERDHQKNLYCKEKGINIIRIREKGCEELNDGISKNYIINKRDISSLENVIKEIFPDVNDTNITRDSQEIYGIHNSTLTQNWKECYAICKEYYETHGNLLIKYNAVIGDKNIGTWISTQRKRYKLGLLSNERIALLEQIGMVWKVRQQTKKRI
jgi:very-short-patch-repair endonuclease